ncbi:unnamed protein product [Cylindrotheca closterium]|uniref:39S ribosomal protein L46, mitochondrial n=1 Tax=Cylindrotheca closterium TaxID=2856 RepID=A0AAD2G2J2_9STRA|nr:unnamed protein product [Cylindrotheca closterium]
MITSRTAILRRISARTGWIGQPSFSTNASYFERKATLKQQRVQAFVDRLQKDDERKKRRDNSPKDVKKQEFREWWEKRRSYEDSLDRKARQAKKDWQIQVAVVLERIPVVLDDIADWEKDYDELKAYFAQFGKEYPKELVPPRKAPVLVTDEEVFAELPPNFRPAPRETKADKSGESNTLDRKLKTRVFFMLDEGKGSWKFPQSSVEGEESLQETAKRIIDKQIGNDLDLYFPSSSPSAVLVKKEEEGDYFGTKTFFVRVQHDEGNVAKGLKHGWLDRDEVVGAVEDEEDSMFYRYLL